MENLLMLGKNFLIRERDLIKKELKKTSILSLKKKCYLIHRLNVLDYEIASLEGAIVSEGKRLASMGINSNDFLDSVSEEEKERAYNILNELGVTGSLESIPRDFDNRKKMILSYILFDALYNESRNSFEDTDVKVRKRRK